MTEQECEKIKAMCSYAPFRHPKKELCKIIMQALARIEALETMFKKYAQHLHNCFLFDIANQHFNSGRPECDCGFKEALKDGVLKRMDDLEGRNARFE